MLYEESLALRRELADKRGIAESLEELAGVAGAQGQAERAARLYGAAEALREAIGAPIVPVDRARYERAVAAARTQLDAAAWTRLRAEGRAMPLEEAIAYALEGERGRHADPRDQGHRHVSGAELCHGEGAYG